MVVFITYKKKVKHLSHIASILASEFPEIKSVIQNVNERHDNVILGDEEILLYGEDVIEDTLLDKRYHISMKSFYQINPRQVEKLYTKAIEFADFKGDETVIDAYCGIGTIGLSLANHVKQVYGVEVVPDAIKNAKENAKRNHVSNIEFTCQDVC